MSPNHTVLVTFKPKTESSLVFAETMESVRTELPNAKGCLGVCILRHAEDDAYTLVEEWQSQQLHGAHVDNLVSTGAWANIEKMLREPPVAIVTAAL